MVNKYKPTSFGVGHSHVAIRPNENKCSHHFPGSFGLAQTTQGMRYKERSPLATLGAASYNMLRLQTRKGNSSSWSAESCLPNLILCTWISRGHHETKSEVTPCH